jgi:hypothetical protein
VERISTLCSNIIERLIGPPVVVSNDSVTTRNRIIVGQSFYVSFLLQGAHVYASSAS